MNTASGSSREGLLPRTRLLFDRYAVLGQAFAGLPPGVGSMTSVSLLGDHVLEGRLAFGAVALAALILILLVAARRIT